MFTWSLHKSADLAVWFSLGGVLSICVTLSVKSKLEGGILQLRHKQNRCKIRNQSRFFILSENFGHDVRSLPAFYSALLWRIVQMRRTLDTDNKDSWGSLSIQAFTVTVWILFSAIFGYTLMSRLRPKLNLTKNQNIMPANISLMMFPMPPIPA